MIRVMAGLIKTFLIGIARIHAREARESCLSSQPSAFLTSTSGKHSIPISQETKIVYIGYKETAEPELGMAFTSPAYSCWMTAIYLLTLLVVHFHIGVCYPIPMSALGFVSPFVNFPVLLTQEILGSRQSNGLGKDSRAPCSFPQVESDQDALAFMHFLKKVQSK